MTPLGAELLEAHVEHEIERLRGPGLGALIEEHVTSLFEWLGDVPLGELVTPDQILGVIDRYVIELKVSGGITELAGQMAHAVYSSTATADTRLDEIVTYESYSEFADKVAGLREAQREVISSIGQSAAIGTLMGRGLSKAAAGILFGDTDDARGSRFRRLLSTFGQTVAPGLEAELAAALRRAVEPHAGRIARECTRYLLDAIDPEWLRQMGDDVWDSLSVRRVAEARAVFSPQDLEDFVVLSLEQWMMFRKTAYFRQVCAEVVRRFFVKYGGESVSSVILDMGVTAAMIVSEVQGFAAPLVEAAHRTGFLEARLRAQLEPFYGSDRVAALLQR